MPTTCQLEFENNPSKVIYSGQYLHGKVHMSLTREITVRCVYLKILGNASTLWTKGDSSHGKTFKGSEEYLDEQTDFVGGTNGDVQLQPGAYHYSFQSYFPPRLPTSFDGEFGSVVYMACIVVDLITGPKKEFEFPFTVIKAINLNADPTLREPTLAKHQIKTFYPCFYCCCFKSKPLAITARTPVAGYVPGQIINFEIIVDNKSKQTVSEFEVQLVKHVIYHDYSESPNHHFESIVVAEAKSRGYDSNQGEEGVVYINLQVPPIPPSDDIPSALIRVIYYCRVFASITCCHNDKGLEIPIIIGTYPILDVPMEHPPRTMTALPMLPPSPANENDTVSLRSGSIRFPYDEPPTYEAAMRLGKNSGEQFVPKYPMFKRQTSYSVRH